MAPCKGCKKFIVVRVADSRILAVNLSREDAMRATMTNPELTFKEQRQGHLDIYNSQEQTDE